MWILNCTQKNTARMEEYMKERIKWIDILRAIAIIFVVIGHTLTEGEVQTYFYSFHIPLFFFISGMLFKNKEEKFATFLIKKIKQLLVPYFCFGIVSILIYAILGKLAANSLGRGNIDGNILMNVLGLLYGSAKTGHLKYNLPLWFLPCLFSTNIIFYFAIKILKENKIIILVPICAVFGYVINYHTNISCLPYGLDTAITMLVFFSLGFLFFKSLEKAKAIYNNKFLLIGLAIITLAVGMLVGLKNGRVRYSADVYNNILLFYISSILSIIGYIGISVIINKCKFLEYIGQKTLAILVMHKMPILFFQIAIPYTKNALAQNNLIIGIVVAFISILLCLVANIIIEKYLPFLYGKWYKNKSQVT